MTLVTHGPEETLALGRRLGRLLGAGDVVALSGPLGSGKTTLTKGLAEGLDVEEPRWVTSPTFVLIHEYPGRVPVYHVDAYRLAGASDAEALGVDELFFGDGVTIVEWADRIGGPTASRPCSPTTVSTFASPMATGPIATSPSSLTAPGTTDCSRSSEPDPSPAPSRPRRPDADLAGASADSSGIPGRHRQRGKAAAGAFLVTRRASGVVPVDQSYR